jgi:hypothetical protein
MPTKFFTNQDDNSLLKKFEGVFTNIASIRHFDALVGYFRTSGYFKVCAFWTKFSKSTIEYLGEWELLYNPNFNYTEFGIIKNEAGTNSFVLSTKNWIEKTNAIGIIAKAGRYGGTYAHKDIAFHFGMWISAEGRNTGNTHY